MLVAFTFFGFRGVAMGSFCGYFVKRFDVVNEGDISFNVFPSCLNIILPKILLFHNQFEFLVETIVYSFGEKPVQRVQLSVSDRLIPSRDCRTEVPAGRFYTRVRFSFTGAVNTDQGLKKIHIRKFLCLGVKFSHGEGLLKSLFSFAFVFLLDPDQDEIDVSRF